MSEMWLNILHCTGQPPQKNLHSSNANSAERIKWSLGYEKDLAKETELTTKKTEHAETKCNGMDLPRDKKRPDSCFPR